MSSPVRLSKADVRKALVRHHFTPASSAMEVFRRLRSIQFDPIAPVGCNHDLVLQARFADYRIGDWEKLAYEDRLIYDGWDKQACLVPYEGWGWRRVFHHWHRPNFKKIFEGHPHAVEAILKEIEVRGPLMPKDLEFKERNADWEGTWFGPNVAKVTLRALWHTGQVMTAGRNRGQHVYDLAERVVPAEYLNQPEGTEEEGKRELVLERHRAVGIVRPTAAYEMWSYQAYAPERAKILKALADEGELVVVDVEGAKAHATPQFISLVDQPSIDPRVVFVAPLDQILWDRKLVAHVFDFDYCWEIYTPEVKRRWGYYVLPVLYGDELVARVEFYCRGGALEVRQWHVEANDLPVGFDEAFGPALQGFAAYCSAKNLTFAEHIPAKTKKFFTAAFKG